jgi:Phosphoribosylaminoimidazole (AIR) synthetase
MLTGAAVGVGDAVLGLASTGAHANGYSLIRKLVADSRADLAARAPFAPEMSLGEALLAPTRVYVKSCLAAIRGGGVRALAHITGGGLVDNIPRVLAPGLGVVLDARAWPFPALFGWIMRAGRVEAAEMARTFNCGLGMVVIAERGAGERVAAALRAGGETVWPIGSVVKRAAGAPAVTITATESAWRG